MTLTQSPTPTVQTEALHRALKLLAASGCKWAVIDAAGTKHGDLEVVTKTKTKRNHQPGVCLKHHRPLTGVLKPGESVLVPFGPFESVEDRHSLRSSITGFCSREWGNKSYITSASERGIEVLRVE